MQLYKLLAVPIAVYFKATRIRQVYSDDDAMYFDRMRFLFHDAKAPGGAGPPLYRGLTTLRHSVGLLSTNGRPVAETST